MGKPAYVLEQLVEEKYWGDILKAVKENLGNEEQLLKTLKRVYKDGYAEAYDKYWYDSS